MPSQTSAFNAFDDQALIDADYALDATYAAACELRDSYIERCRRGDLARNASIEVAMTSVTTALTAERMIVNAIQRRRAEERGKLPLEQPAQAGE